MKCPFCAGTGHKRVSGVTLRCAHCGARGRVSLLWGLLGWLVVLWCRARYGEVGDDRYPA